MVDGEHHRAAGRGAEHPREPVLHAPIELVRALEEETGRGLRLIRVEPCTFGVGFWHDSSRPVWLVGVHGVLLNRTTCRPAISVLRFSLGQFAPGRSRPTGYLPAPTPRCHLYACARTCCRCPVLIHSRAPAAPATAVRRDAFGSLSQECRAKVSPPSSKLPASTSASKPPGAPSTTLASACHCSMRTSSRPSLNRGMSRTPRRPAGVTASTSLVSMLTCERSAGSN